MLKNNNIYIYDKFSSILYEKTKRVLKSDDKVYNVLNNYYILTSARKETQ